MILKLCKVVSERECGYWLSFNYAQPYDRFYAKLVILSLSVWKSLITDWLNSFKSIDKVHWFGTKYQKIIEKSIGFYLTSLAAAVDFIKIASQQNRNLAMVGFARIFLIVT